MCPRCQVTSLRAMGSWVWEFFWPVGDIENLIITCFSVIILQSEQHWGHILQPFLCSMTKITGSFLCMGSWHRWNFWKSVKKGASGGFRSSGTPALATDVLSFGTKSGEIFPHFRDWEVETIYCRGVSTQGKDNIMATSVNKFWKKVERE